MHTTDEAPGAGYEKRDATIRPLAESGVLLVVLCLVSFWSMIYVHHWLQGIELEKAPLGNALTPAREIPPGPLLETAPHMPVNWAETKQLQTEFFKKSSLGDARSVELARLHGYGWVDEQSKIAHIPIQQAMQKLVEQGVPTRK
jgi:hypothetical protein